MGAGRWRWLVIAGLVTADLLVFNRVALLSGFDAVPGDLGDGRFNLAVLEHWYRVALGAESWASPGYYYPVAGTLGYSDALVLLAPAYGAARLAGLGTVAALAATVMAASALGLIGMLVFVRRALGLAWPAALAAAAAFATSSALYQSLTVGHVQMLAVEAIPWLACLVWRCLRAADGAPGAAVTAALLLSALLLTSFYTGWFVGVHLLVMAGIGLAMAVAALGAAGTIGAGRGWLVGRRLALLAGLAALALGLVPFLLLYGPVAAHAPARPWAEVVRTLPDPSQLFEARGNLLWGPAAEALWPGLAGQGGELGKGLSWGLLAVFAVTLIRLAVGPVPGIAPEIRRLGLVLGGGVAVCWLLLVRIDGWSLWSLIYAWAPGGGTIRSVFRFNLVLAFSVATVAAIGVQGAWLWAGRRGHRHPARVAVAALAAALAVEQVNGLPATLSWSRDFAAVAALPPAPPGCRALVLLPADPPPAYHRWSRQLDAVMVAQAQGLPTLNGYGGQAPPGWGLYDPTDQRGYRAALVAWADRYGLWPGLCGVDLGRELWFPVDRGPP